MKREDAVSVSLTLPLQKEAYKATVLFPFFDGLIPEGWLLGVVSRTGKSIRMTDLDCCCWYAGIVLGMSI